jgi:hypothetical protein
MNDNTDGPLERMDSRGTGTPRSAAGGEEALAGGKYSHHYIDGLADVGDPVGPLGPAYQGSPNGLGSTGFRAYRGALRGLRVDCLDRLDGLDCLNSLDCLDCLNGLYRVCLERLDCLDRMDRPHACDPSLRHSRPGSPGHSLDLDVTT